jgi:hypothetical protein
MYNISTIGIVTTNSPLYNEYILVKNVLKKKKEREIWRKFPPSLSIAGLQLGAGGS